MRNYRAIAATCFLILGAIAAVSAPPGKGTRAGEPRNREYFDAHNHNYSGILPFYAYADLKAFVEHPEDPAKVDLEHRRQLWQFLASYQYSGDRYSPGSLATVKAYGQNISGMTEAQINGALERVLTTTPWTDFDSAYAFRGAPVGDYLRKTIGSDAVANQALCDASILELALTNTAYSEQFINFSSGWGNPAYAKLDNIRCFLNEPRVLARAGRFAGMHRPTPQIKVLLMTNTSAFGATSDGQQWINYRTSGQCQSSTGILKTAADLVRNALLGRDADGREIIKPEEERAYFDGVTGIDTAGPEFTCFTAPEASSDKGAGMEIYKQLVRAVYSASRERRGAGWHGKMLVHTHVGEGGVRYLFDSNSTDIFSTFPGIQMDAATGKPVHVEQSGQNIKRLIQAVRELKAEIRDIDNFVVFRFGHVTHADMQDALDMKTLRIEADINLQSNISTRAYYNDALVSPRSVPLTEAQQFEYNNLVRETLNRPDFKEVLADHGLKYMLAAGVRTLAGSDGGGEEHSDIEREYKLIGQLIVYWYAHDKEFQQHAPKGLSERVLFENVAAHLRDMRTDRELR